MALLESLLQTYGANEPIPSAEIAFESYSRPWICKQLTQLCRARTPIPAENVAVLCFLELMNELDTASLDVEKKDVLGRFVEKQGVTRKDITAYAPFFPDKAMRNLIESEMIYRVAQ